MGDFKIKLEKLKKGTCILLAATLIGTVFAGCSKDSNTESKEIESTSYVNESDKEYYFVDHIEKVYVMKYEDLRKNPRYVVIYPRLHHVGPYDDRFYLYNLDKSEVLYKGIHDDYFYELEEDIKDYGNKLGYYIGYYDLSRFLTAEYGRKKKYTNKKIQDLITRLNCGELVFDGNTIKEAETTDYEMTTEENTKYEDDSNVVSTTKSINR